MDEMRTNFTITHLQSLQQERSASYNGGVCSHMKGVHVVQVIQGCEWDEETDVATGFSHFRFDDTDFMSYNIKNWSWTAVKKEAKIVTQILNAVEAETKEHQILFTETYPEQLKLFLNYEKRFPIKTVPPSVSLLQKSPSSPVRCHATGFYPNRADMFWRKDGEETHENVDHGEILPNHDGTFQLRVDLDISSVKDEDWSRYDCVFQFSEVDNKTVTKLDEAAIRANWKTGNGEEFPFTAVLGVVVCLLLLIVGITGVIIWRRRRNGFRPASSTTHQTEIQLLTDPGEC